MQKLALSIIIFLSGCGASITGFVPAGFEEPSITATYTGNPNNVVTITATAEHEDLLSLEIGEFGTVRASTNCQPPQCSISYTEWPGVEGTYREYEVRAFAVSSARTIIVVVDQNTYAEEKENQIPGEEFEQQPVFQEVIVVPDPECGNGVVEAGERCENNGDCPEEYECNGCNCEYLPFEEPEEIKVVLPEPVFKESELEVEEVILAESCSRDCSKSIEGAPTGCLIEPTEEEKRVIEIVNKGSRKVLFLERSLDDKMVQETYLVKKGVWMRLDKCRTEGIPQTSPVKDNIVTKSLKSILSISY